MKELIKISTELIGTEETNSVNARELHVELEISKRYADWINHQISSLGLEENIDYIKFCEDSKFGRPKKEYIITLDTAKHISMASRTAKGKEVRKYFIEAEKALHVKANQEVLKPNLDYKGGVVSHILHGFKHEINPTALLSVALIRELREMLGADGVRNFYSKLLDIPIDPIKLLGDEVSAFCDEMTFKDSKSFTCIDEIYEGYVLWLRTKGDKEPLPKITFSKRFSKLNRDLKFQKRFGSERRYAYRLVLKGDLR